jgi:hypothetical protein
MRRAIYIYTNGASHTTKPHFFRLYIRPFCKKQAALLFWDTTTRALGMLHFAHRLVLLAAHTAPVGRFTILITAFIKASI